jgi:hypothetical protein
MSAVLDHQLDTASLDCWRSDPAAFCRALFGRPRHRQTLRVAARREAVPEIHVRCRCRAAAVPNGDQRGIRKSGKTVFGAIVIIVMILLFAGRHAESYCVANDLEQAQSRVFEMCRRIVEAEPVAAA